jgi:hypothetical protein
MSGMTRFQWKSELGIHGEAKTSHQRGVYESVIAYNIELFI